MVFLWGFFWVFGFLWVFLPTVLFRYKQAMNILSHIHGKDSRGKTGKKSINMHTKKYNAKTRSVDG